MSRLSNWIRRQDPVKVSCGKWLWLDAGLIGALMLIFTQTLRKTGPYLAYFLRMTGVFPADCFSRPYYGLTPYEYLLFYTVTYLLAMGVPTLIFFLLRVRRKFPHPFYAPRKGNDAFLGLAVGLGGCVTASIIANYVQAYLDRFDVPGPSSGLIWGEGNDLLLILLNILTMAVLPAVLEETAFRGYVLRALRPYGDGFALVVSALLFGLMHGNVSQSLFAFGAGLIFGWLYIKTDNIFLSIASHFINNAFSLALTYVGSLLPEGEYQTVQNYALTIIGLLTVVALAVLLAKRSPLLSPVSPFRPLSVGTRSVIMVVSPVFLAGVAVLVWNIVGR